MNRWEYTHLWWEANVFKVCHSFSPAEGPNDANGYGASGCNVVSILEKATFSPFTSRRTGPRSTPLVAASGHTETIDRQCKESHMMRWLGHLAVFVLVLAALKFFFGWNISIIGSVVFTIIFGAIFAIIDRR